MSQGLAHPTARVFSSVIFLLLVASFGLFDDFSKPHVNMWDEATYALNAYDQALNGLSLSLTSEGQPDYYNTKPPLSIWMEAIAIRTFGFNTFGIRFHSILLSFLTALLIWFTCFKVSNRNSVAILAGSIFLLSPGFIHTHVARTGDLDATVVFFETLYVSATLLFALEKIGWKSFTAIFTVGAFGAFLSKGIAGFFMMPSSMMIVFLLRKNQLRRIRFYLPILLSILLSVGYYILRFFQDPEYWRIAYRTEIARYWDESVISWIHKPFSFYFVWIGSEGFYPHVFLLLLGLVPLLFLKQLRNLLLTLYLIPLLYLLIISVPDAKMHWYDAATYPWLALLAAVCIHLCYVTLEALVPKHRLAIGGTLVGVVLCMLFVGYSKVQEANQFQLDTVTELEAEGKALKLMQESRTLLPAFNVYKPSDNPEFNDQVKVAILIAIESDTVEISLLEETLPDSNDKPLLIATRILTDSLRTALVPSRIDYVGQCVLIQ